MRRHKERHLPASVVKAQHAEDVLQADSLLDRLRAINQETAEVLREVKRIRDYDLWLKAIARAERQIELEGKLIGELHDQQVINVLMTPEWMTVQAALSDALTPYPEARLAVAERLQALEAGR